MGVQTSTDKSLSNIGILADLGEAELRRLAQRCAWRRYKNNQMVFDRGSEGREVYFVVEGAVNIVNFSASGREVTFATASAGDTFGELAVIDSLPRSASVFAREATLLASLPASVFLDLLQSRAEVTFKVLQRLAQIVRSGDDRIMELSTLAATHRVYAELLRMARPDAAVPGLWVVRPLPPLREIASRVSTTRETVVRSLSQLYPNGLLRRKGRNLYLMDRAALEQITHAIQSHGSGRAH
jgi:CRP-like cAMP-binding protein